MKKTKERCIAAIRDTDGIPTCVRSSLSGLTGFEVNRFDHSYIEFLEEQIKLDARTEEWRELLRSRRNNLEPYCDTDLVSCSLDAEGAHYSFRIDMESAKVVHWESQ